MATHGLYVQRIASGAIYGVQIEDDAKNDWSITASEYMARNYEPPLATLPDMCSGSHLKSVVLAFVTISGSD